MGICYMPMIQLSRYSLGITAILLMSPYCFAQTNALAPRKARFSVVAATGMSYFSANTWQSQSRFPKNEPRIGFRFHYTIASRLEVTSSINFGCKIKGERAYPPGSTALGLPLRLSSPFNELEEAVNSNNHFFFEVPVGLALRIMPKWFLGGGIDVRSFLANGGHEFSAGGDFFSGRTDWGPYTDLRYVISERVRCVGTYYLGVTKIYGAEGTLNGSQLDYEVRNCFFHVGVELILKRRKLNN